MDMVDMADMELVSVKLRLRLKLRLKLRLMLRLMLRLSPVRLTLLVLNARTKRIGNAIKSPSKPLARFPARLARPSLTPPTLNSVRISSPPTVRRFIKRYPTPLLLSDMTLRLCPTAMVDMLGMAIEAIAYELIL